MKFQKTYAYQLFELSSSSFVNYCFRTLFQPNESNSMIIKLFSIALPLEIYY